MSELDTTTDGAPERAGFFGRRGLIAGGVGAILGGLLGRSTDAAAATGQPMVTGTDNFSQSPTSISYDPTTVSPGQFGFQVFNDERSVVGAGGYNYGIDAGATYGSFSTGDVIGAIGAHSRVNTDLLTSTFAGVVGIDGTHGIGVWGTSPNGVGGCFTLDPAAAPRLRDRAAPAPPSQRAARPAAAAPGIGVALVAENKTGGLALQVKGRTQISTAGQSTIRAHTRSRRVANRAVTSKSLILVTLLGNPRGAVVSWVERRPGSGFVVHLTGAVSHRVPFSYAIVEHP